MRKPVHVLLACCAMAPAIAPTSALAADSGAQEVGREIGAILAWRMGPELAEETCRDIEPAGAQERRKLLKAWADRNAALIKTVDERVAEVVPLVYPASAGDAVAAVRAQVKRILLETISSGDAVQLKNACEEDAKPTSPRWSSNGVPQVHNSLAALYDWKTQKAQGVSAP